MDYFIVELQDSIGNIKYNDYMYIINTEKYTEMEYYYGLASFFIYLFMLSTLVGICLCNIRHPPNYRPLELQDKHSEINV